jgi:hypothetical protein
VCGRLNGDGSPCAVPARYKVGFTFEAVGGSKPVEATSMLGLCEAHAKAAKVSDLVDDRVVRNIQDMLRAAHLAPADPSTFKLLLVPIA